MCLYHLKISLSCELAKASGVETVSAFTENGIGFNEITLYWMITNTNVTQTLYILFICGCQYHPPFRQTRKLPYSFKWFILWGTLLKKSPISETSTWISKYQYIKYILMLLLLISWTVQQIFVKIHVIWIEMFFLYQLMKHFSH